jgi:3-dehydroquinate dehydratase-2
MTGQQLTGQQLTGQQLTGQPMTAEPMTEQPARRVLVLNGPNLGRLGRRQPEIYGSTTHAELATLCVDWGRELGLAVEVRQTNHEGALLDWLNEAADDEIPVVLNAAAWTHYSYALFDACAQLVAPLVEVHISDPTQRPEEFRHHSMVTPYAAAVVAGQGIDGYRQALHAVADATAGSAG